MSRRKKRMAPAANQDHSNNTTDSPSLPGHAALVTGVHVVVVQVRGDHVPPRYRRRVMFNLPAAEMAVSRATMEGLDASVGLYRLVPVAGDAR